MDALRTFIAQFGMRRLAIIGGSGLVAVIAVGILAMSAGKPRMAYLYSDLDPAGAQIVTERLRGMGIPFELSPDGTAVLAPADRLAELRMNLASEQIGGKIGYAILDAEEPFGTSASRARLNETRAIEGELARSIQSLHRVRQARVHLVMPERQLFAAEARPASAAITLKTTGRLSSQQTDAIRYLVAAAVPELSPDRISIVDQNGTLLARAGDGEIGAGALDERERALEISMREDLEAMIERIVGPGRVRAQVAAELNPEHVREEAEVFDPDRQVIARTTSVETNDQADERSAAGEVGVAAQLPENQQAPAAAGDQRRSVQSERSEEVTYDNSRVRTTSVRPGGSLRRLTVSVMVDGNYTTGPDGAQTYAPRSQAEIERLTRLVENAIGYDEARGDRVVVENIRFMPPETVAEEESGLLGGVDVADLATKLILGGLALAALLIVARNLKREKVPALEGQLIEPQLLQASNVQVNNLTPEMREMLARAAGGDETAMRDFMALQRASEDAPAVLDQEIDIAQVQGRIKASTLKRVGEVVTNNTPEAAAVIRRWMNA